MQEKVVFPKKEKFSFRNRIIDALLDIRLTLSVKKLTSDVIMKSELKVIIDEAKQKAQNLEVGSEIDKVFAEYFEPGSKNPDKKESLSVEQMQSVIDDNVYEDLGGEKGRAFVKNDGYHRSGGGESDMNSSTRAA